ncbi:hypothetical protein DFA_02334 [Cavenderia fasciculata]|uniref:Uncharacterized protein n=1 Tax=Cavenderia fasciculata TaxID=261658 RepID=F4PZ59_CACFS|nr:uncharacterized protein DFA_02334 [Cavenderia fasciculata]EGG19088.1 hypothetical protein DFA_02334 [Cavenderia fasciculata]|eukprot:XP_004366721.1 hypothetical protein DFA_02334 [Cavenderia fasciculata]
MNHQSIYNDIIGWVDNNNNNNNNNNQNNNNNNQNNNNNNNNDDDDDDFWHNQLYRFIKISGYQQFMMTDDIAKTDVDLYTDIMDLLFRISTPHYLQHIPIILTLVVEVGQIIISKDKCQSLNNIIKWMESLKRAQNQFTFTPAVNSAFERAFNFF